MILTIEQPYKKRLTKVAVPAPKILYYGTVKDGSRGVLLRLYYNIDLKEISNVCFEVDGNKMTVNRPTRVKYSLNIKCRTPPNNRQNIRGQGSVPFS